MDKQRWAAFDCDLRIRIDASNQARYEASQPATDKAQETKVNEELHEEYAHMTRLVRESIEAVVPPKTWTKKTAGLYQKKLRRCMKLEQENTKQANQPKKNESDGTGK